MRPADRSRLPAGAHDAGNGGPAAGAGGARPAARSLAARALTVLRDEGWRSFGLKAASELGYRRMLLLAAALDPPPAALPSMPALRCAVMQARDVDAYLAFRPDAEPAELATRWREGCLCYVVRDEGRIVAAAWSRTNRASVTWIDYEFALAQDEVYLFDAYTQAASRRRGIAHALCIWQLRHLRQAGFRRALRATAVENTVALRAHAKSGFRPIATVTRLRLGPWRRTLRRDIAS